MKVMHNLLHIDLYFLSHNAMLRSTKPDLLLLRATSQLAGLKVTGGFVNIFHCYIMLLTASESCTEIEPPECKTWFPGLPLNCWTVSPGERGN